jgi:hypothetical protein
VHSSVIGKIEKAMRYAHEPDRVTLEAIRASFAGDNGTHTVTLDADAWQCDCHLFESAGGCTHTLAIQKMLDPMLTDQARETPLYGPIEIRADKEPVPA